MGNTNACIIWQINTLDENYSWFQQIVANCEYNAIATASLVLLIK